MMRCECKGKTQSDCSSYRHLLKPQTGVTFRVLEKPTGTILLSVMLSSWYFHCLHLQDQEVQLDPEDQGTMIIQTVGNYIRDGQCCITSCQNWTGSNTTGRMTYLKQPLQMECSVHPSTMLCFLVRKVLTTTTICIWKTTTGKFMIQ